MKQQTFDRPVNEQRDALLRTFTAGNGTKIGTADFGDVWVCDGKVWLLDATTATDLGDYYAFKAKLRRCQGPAGYEPAEGMS